MHKLILQKTVFTNIETEYLEDVFQTKLKVCANYAQLLSEKRFDLKVVKQIRDRFACDVNLLPETFEPENVRLVVSDMDSTLINIECVDEIADFAGVKAEVSSVTEAAMRGELDFAGSLIKRVALLEGLDEAALQQVYDNRLALNPGAEHMLKSLKNRQIKFALVSGGFTFFTDRLKQRLGLDFTLANSLEIKNKKLTGNVLGEIIGGQAKATFLLEACKDLAISPNQVVAIGDGANDLNMMAEAGLGVAYHAKPKVQGEADCAINYSGLEGLLSLLLID